MSHNVPDPSPPSSMENDSHHDAHVHGLRLVLGSILAPKRPFPPSHTGSHSASGTSSPFQHWHYPGAAGSVGSSSGQDSPPLPSPQPHPSPVVPLYHHQPPYQHAHHQPTPTPHPHQYHSHVHAHAHAQPQSHTHVHASGHSRLSFTHSTSSTPSESLSPSPTPSPRLATPPPMLDHAPHTYAHQSAVSNSEVTKTAMAATADAAADAKRAHFLTTLQSKSAWDAMIHGSWV